MQALAKLVAVNRPGTTRRLLATAKQLTRADLILFVGEALAGNDSVDQVH